MQTATANPLAYALGYHKIGWSVIPLKPRDKRPLGPWKLYQKERAEKGTIAHWFSDYRDSNLGIVTGAVSGIVVLDVDTAEAYDKMRYEHGIPRTPIARTGKGWHFYFEHPGFEVSNFARKRPGLDLRGDGGYVVAPPSIHPDGHAYEWEVSPNGIDPAPIPIWLLEMLEEEEREPYVHQPNGDYSAYVQQAFDNEIASLFRAANGSRNDSLNRSAFNLGTLIGAGELDETDVWQALLRTARAIGLDERESSATIKSGLTKGISKPRQLPERDSYERSEPTVTIETPTEPIVYERPPGSTWEDLEQVIAPITWAWEPWLPNGMLTMLAAVSGAGKSILVMRLCASVIRGEPWPDGTEYEGEPGRVLWCEAEAAQALNLERATQWNLPRDAFQSPLPNPLDDVHLSDPAHRELLTAWMHQPDIKLGILDSLSGAHSFEETSAEAHEITKWLAELVRNCGKPFLLIHHLNQSVALNNNDRITLERVRGGSRLVQTPRVVWAMDAPDANDTDHKRMYVIKNNLARFPVDIGLRIKTGDMEFGEAPQTPHKETLQDRAEDMLLAILNRGGGKALASDIIDELEQAGISKHAGYRAKDGLNIESVKKEGRWWWMLPAPAHLQEQDREVYF